MIQLVHTLCNRWLLLFFFLPLVGCATQLKKNEPVGLDETVFVIGIKPAEFNPILFPGYIRDGKFHLYTTRNGYGNNPEEGYMITKVKPGDLLGITKVLIKRGSFGPTFKMCGNKKTLVFKVPKGKVVYISDIRYEEHKGYITFEYADKFNEAKEYIDREYPALRNRMEKWEYELLPITASCTETIHVTVPRYN
ncbi:MAG: hypothetical protein AMJ53_11275 [Gammaproteobacteria bacterium SG8_11]|nr:MAG: hypothetical protein AMJ53_11275 [Gammaproteobacteria bacterium SG8_11]